MSTTLTTQNWPTLKTPAAFRIYTSEARGFQQNECGCKNDWPLTTTERALSNEFFPQVQSMPDPRRLSALAAFLGQFIDHDVVRSENDDAQGAFTITMTPSDAVIHLKRILFQPDEQSQCREPLNFITPELDLSTVYGDGFSPEKLATLRTSQGSGCKLQMGENDLLPLENGMWVAGDPRVTEHSILTSYHTLFAREHNRLCDALASKVPGWSEEERFWKARQINIAAYQRIIYEEWLPAVLGSQIHLLDTVPLKRTDTAVTAEFAVVAFRYGHSAIPDPIGPFQLPALFFNTTIVETLGIEPLLQATFSTPAEQVNHHVIDGLRNFLFAAGPNVIGEDLISRNLFRAHEVGMATYATLAQCYGQVPYNPPQNENPYLGVLMEPLVPGSSLPATIAHTVAEQFRRLRQYDPDFYTNLPRDEFTSYARKATLAQVIRANTPLKNVPHNVFFT